MYQKTWHGDAVKIHLENNRAQLLAAQQSLIDLNRILSKAHARAIRNPNQYYDIILEAIDSICNTQEKINDAMGTQSDALDIVSAHNRRHKKAIEKQQEKEQT